MTGRPAPGPSPDREELERHLSKLRQWAHAAQPLGIKVPALPGWAVEYAAAEEESDAWREVLRGVERIAQQRIVQALEGWQQQTQGRLRRLEAYSVDSRLEREEIEDALYSAKTGDVARALATFQQVARVLALKERHLDQAREELEKLISLLRDMEALDIPSPDDPKELAAELERELRRGRLADLKQRLRELHSEAIASLERVLPPLISRYGDQIIRWRAEGLRVDPEAGALARAARSLARGHPETAVRELRRLSTLRSSAKRPMAVEGDESEERAEATGASRTTGRPLPRSDGGEPPPR
jgi:hypothetical protein